MTAFGSQDWAFQRLAPHKARLWSVIAAATKRFNRLDPDDLLTFNGRCAADVLNAFIIAEARLQFEGVKTSLFIDRNNTTFHSLNGCVLWYKQLGADDLPSNIPTPTAEELMQGHFSFVPNELLLVVGFKLDSLKKKVQSVEMMRFGVGRRVEFLIAITEVSTQERVITMPNKLEPQRTRRRTRIEIRNGFEQKAFGSTDE